MNDKRRLIIAALGTLLITVVMIVIGQGVIAGLMAILSLVFFASLYDSARADQYETMRRERWERWQETASKPSVIYGDLTNIYKYADEWERLVRALWNSGIDVTPEVVEKCSNEADRKEFGGMSGATFSAMQHYLIQTSDLWFLFHKHYKWQCERRGVPDQYMTNENQYEFPEFRESERFGPVIQRPSRREFWRLPN